MDFTANEIDEDILVELFGNDVIATNSLWEGSSPGGAAPSPAGRDGAKSPPGISQPSQNTTFDMNSSPDVSTSIQQLEESPVAAGDLNAPGQEQNLIERTNSTSDNLQDNANDQGFEDQLLGGAAPSLAGRDGGMSSSGFPQPSQDTLPGTNSNQDLSVQQPEDSPAAAGELNAPLQEQNSTGDDISALGTLRNSADDQDLDGYSYWNSML